MKIKLNKELKIELLNALQNGVLDTNKVPELVSQIKDMHPFLELMKSATSIQSDDQKVEWTNEDVLDVNSAIEDEYFKHRNEIYLKSEDTDYNQLNK